MCVMRLRRLVEAGNTIPAVILLLIVLAGYSLFILYQRLPNIVAITCDVYGNPIYGLKSEVMLGQVAPVFITSILFSILFSFLSFKPYIFSRIFVRILDKVGIGLSEVDGRVFFLLTAYSIYVIVLGWWIGYTSLISASRDTPLYPSLVLMWYISGLLLIPITALTYYLMEAVRAHS